MNDQKTKTERLRTFLSIHFFSLFFLKIVFAMIREENDRSNVFIISTERDKAMDDKNDHIMSVIVMSL